MNQDPTETDERIGELLRSELPVPEHAEGYRERVAALLTAEAVERAGRSRWWSGVRLSGRGSVEQQPVEREGAMQRVPRSRSRRRRLALAGSLAFVVVVAVAVGTVALFALSGGSQMVLRITDETIVDVNNPAAPPSTTIVTSFASLADTKAILKQLTKAINAGDWSAVSGFYVSNAYLENSIDKTSIQVSASILDYWRKARDELGLRIELVGDPVAHDRYMAQHVKYVLPNAAGSTGGVQIFQIDTSGHIAYEWLMGWVTE
jgi:hypothetical protein